MVSRKPGVSVGLKVAKPLSFSVASSKIMLKTKNFRLYKVCYLGIWKEGFGTISFS